MMTPLRVLITGVCGHSYGAQIAKSLSLQETDYILYGGDANLDVITSEIFLEDLFQLPRAGSDAYLKELLEICNKYRINFLIEGSEAEQRALNNSRNILIENSITWVTNNKENIILCSDKKSFSFFLRENNFYHPLFYDLNDYKTRKIRYPVILKPNFQSGGSKNVYLAQTDKDIEAILQLSKMNLEEFCIQEYIGTYDSEYTVGVLHSSHGEFLGAATLKRDLTQALSVKLVVDNITERPELGEKLVISSGFSQGELMHHELIEKYCISIAEKLGSTGPLNFQGRLHRGKFYIFEINPRFSGTSFMRALSGFNEADLWIKNLNLDRLCQPYSVKKSQNYRRIVKEIKIIEG